jgi:hypothetical protein
VLVQVLVQVQSIVLQMHSPTHLPMPLQSRHHLPSSSLSSVKQPLSQQVLQRPA